VLISLAAAADSVVAVSTCVAVETTTPTVATIRATGAIVHQTLFSHRILLALVGFLCMVFLAL
jgi:hypothetical protein